MHKGISILESFPLRYRYNYILRQANRLICLDVLYSLALRSTLDANRMSALNELGHLTVIYMDTAPSRELGFVLQRHIHDI